MNQENSRIAKNTALLYIRTIIVMLISLYTSRVVLQSLGVNDFGIYNVVGGVVSMFSFINGAMSGSTLRFLTFELGKGDKKRLNDVFCTSIQIHLAISLIVIFLAETIGLWFLYKKMIIPFERLGAALIVYQVSVLTSIVSIMNVPYNSLIIAHEKMSSFAYISILDVVLKLLIAIYISLSVFDKMIIYSLLMLAVYFTIILIYIIYCRKSFPEACYHIVKEYELITRMSKFAFWNLFSNLAYVTYTQGLNILLNIFFGPVVNAARGISVQVQSAVDRCVQSFQSALNPQITKTYADNNRDRLLFLIDVSSRYSFYLVLIFIIPLIVGMDFVLKLWLGIVPDHTLNFVRLSLMAIPVSVMLNPLNIATQATGKVKMFFFITGIIQLLILPFAYTALKCGGPPEAVYIVYLVHQILSAFIYIKITCDIINMSMMGFFINVVIRVLFVAIMACLIPFIFNVFVANSDSLLIVLLNMTASEISVLACIYLFGIRINERQIIISTLKKRLFKDESII